MEITEATERQQINWGPILVVILGSFMAFLNSSVVNVAIPKMMIVFGASQDAIQWVLTGYMLAMGMVMPISGYLGDTYGYKRVFIISLVIFVVGSALSGLAWSVNSLVAFRIIQALGGGLMSPIGMALIYKVVPREKIGLVMGVFGISAMAAPAMGPTIGGYLVEYANWRLIFYINVPIGIFNVFLALSNLKESERIKGKTIDRWGILLSSTGLFCLLMALSKGSNQGWSSPFIVGMFVVAFITLAVFVYIELNHPEPILDLRLFKNFVFTMSLIITSIISIGMFGVTYLIPVFMQNVLGYSAMQSGLITFPASVVAGIMMPISGRIFDDYGPRMISVVGLAVFAVSSYMMHTFDLFTPLSVIVVLLAIRGAGMGLVMMPASTAGMNTVPLPLIGRASAMSNVIRQVAGSFGIAVFTTVLQNQRVLYYAQLAQNVNLDSTQSLNMQNTLESLAISNGVSITAMKTMLMAAIHGKITLMAMASAIDDCFLLSAALGVIALVLCPFLKEKRQLDKAGSTLN